MGSVGFIAYSAKTNSGSISGFLCYVLKLFPGTVEEKGNRLIFFMFRENDRKYVLY